MRIIAVINQKGGVAKTTTTANLGYALASMGKRVTLADLDPQGHLSAFYGIQQTGKAGTDALILSGEKAGDVVRPLRDNLSLIPAGASLDRVEQMTQGRLEASKRLKSALAELEGQSDYVLLDCPPSSGLLVIFALYACDEVLIPVNGDYLSLMGVSHFLATLKNVERLLGHPINYRLVLTRFHPRRRLARNVKDKLLEYFPGRIFATAIREVSALAECPSFGKPIFEYAPRSHGSSDYRALADDLVHGRMM